MFQKKSYAAQAKGIPGQISKSNPETIYEAVAADNTVCVGCFVQRKQNPTQENEVVGASGVAITGQIVGVAVKDRYISSCGVNAVNTFNPGDYVAVLTSGSIFIEVEVQAKAGQYVFLKNDTGALVFDNKMVKADHTYTGFIVTIGNSANEDGIIEITTSQANTIPNVAAITPA